MTKRTGCLIALALLIFVPFIAWQIFIYQWYQGVLPVGVTAPVVQYRNTETHGFGPGGDAVGIVVYRMDSRTAARLKQKGIAYLNEAASERGPLTRKERDRVERRTYDSWLQTPVSLEKIGKGHGEHNCGREPGIGAYLDSYNFRCSVSPSVIAEANRILATPGAYYSYRRGRSSLVVLAPAERKVIFAYVD